MAEANNYLCILHIELQQKVQQKHICTEEMEGGIRWTSYWLRLVW